MKKLKLLAGVVFDLAAIAIIALFCGCEVDSASQKIYIEPDAATLYYGESVTLTAKNGYIYTWSLSQDTWGTLSSRSGSTVTYKSLYDPTSVQVQIITVSSTFTDNSGAGSSTNGSATNTAQAYITLMPSSTSDVDAASSS